jgi:hypothetical protein
MRDKAMLRRALQRLRSLFSPRPQPLPRLPQQLWFRHQLVLSRAKSFLKRGLRLRLLQRRLRLRRSLRVHPLEPWLPNRLRA